MIFESFSQYINEDFVGFYQDYRTKKMVDVYKNPKSIKKFDSETKGVVGLEYDLYVIDSAWIMGHDDLKEYLNQHGEPVDVYNWSNQPHLVRYEKTDIFYLSEIYKPYILDLHKKTIYNSLLKAKKKNPKYTFILLPYFHGERNINDDLKNDTVIKI
jgi:hypothetical protein